MLGLWEVFGDCFCNLCECTKDTRGIAWDHDGNVVADTYNDEIMEALIEIQGENIKPWRVCTGDITK